jgi:predicted nucleotidyltransferase
MFRSLTEYAAAAGVESDPGIQQLVQAEQRSAESIESMSAYIARKLEATKGVDIVAFGSLARREWTDQSDFDYLVVVHELGLARELREALKVAERARQKLEAGAPGATGMFGVIVSSAELIARIGLETDTNQTLTRRLLMLEESVSLYDSVAHKSFLKSMLDRYLIEYEGREKVGTPRFLLNDVVRHWRTVAVDYQAKNWQRVTDEGWGLRYLKLKISRKLAFAGTLAPLLTVGVNNDKPTADLLLRTMSPAPLVRLANLHAILDESGQSSLLGALKVAGKFNLALNSQEFRREAGQVGDRDETGGPLFQESLEDAQELQGHLTSIFLGDNSPLRTLSQEYLVF